MKIGSYLWVAVILLVLTAGGLRPLAAQDAEQTKWTTTGSLHLARVGHTATLLPNGRVLIVGGYGGEGELSDAELYEPDEGVFVNTGNLETARTDHTATLLSNGQVLVVGGQFQGRTLASAELYDPATGQWTSTGSLHVARSYHTATLLANGQVLVAGGSRIASPPVFAQGAPPGSALDIAEVYNPATGKWTVVDNLHTARYVHLATLLRNGEVLVTGGLSAKGGGDTLASAELYNPITQTWTQTGNLLNMRFDHTATLLPNGQVLVVGGQFHENRLAGAELYNPSSGIWTPTESPQAVHTGHNATLLPDGRVLVAGGATDSGVLTNAELYNPSAGTWEITASLNAPRAGQTATVLSNGQVLVTGGGNGSMSPTGVLASAELYGPVVETNKESTSKPPLEEVVHSTPAAPDTTSPLLTLATCLVIFTVCLVILTACVVVLLSAWLVFVLIQHWRK